jgi:hypothetical protein
MSKGFTAKIEIQHDHHCQESFRVLPVAAIFQNLASLLDFKW